MKIVGGKLAPGCKDVGAYVASIFKGGVAEQLHGELQEGIYVFFLKNYCSKLLSAFLLKETVVVSLSFLTLASKAFKKGVTHIGTNSLLIEQIPLLE